MISLFFRCQVLFSTLLVGSLTAEIGQITINFDQQLQEWDGFGVNYVETAQTRDYAVWPQDYGGFSVLSETARQEIIQLIFGDDGLKPGVVKMFIDPFHEGSTAQDNDNDDPLRIDLDGYTHEKTTAQMRYFVREGLALTRQRGDDLDIICTLYGPPPWTTQQRMVRGRDMDPAQAPEIAEYIAAFAQFMITREGFPIRYVSVHNEGLDPPRYTADGRDDETVANHDYNLRWSPAAVAEFLPLMRRVLDANGMAEVGVAPGETMQWYLSRSTADAIGQRPDALAAVGLITAHGFPGTNNPLRWNYCPSPFDPIAIRTLQNRRPDLHAWTTSTSWGAMDITFVDHLRGHIYENGNNAIIPWATIQRTSEWRHSDPNSSCAIKVNDDGTYAILSGYHLFKQVSRAGQPGMRVATVHSGDPLVGAMAFSRGQSSHPDAFVLINRSWYPTTVRLKVSGSTSDRFEVRRTIVDTFCERFTEDEIPPVEIYAPHPDLEFRSAYTTVELPGLSVTTYFAR